MLPAECGGEVIRRKLVAGHGDIRHGCVATCELVQSYRPLACVWLMD
jgi:hypothetical protein